MSGFPKSTYKALQTTDPELVARDVSEWRHKVKAGSKGFFTTLVRIDAISWSTLEKTAQGHAYKLSNYVIGLGAAAIEGSHSEHGKELLGRLTWHLAKMGRAYLDVDSRGGTDQSQYIEFLNSISLDDFDIKMQENIILALIKVGNDAQTDKTQVGHVAKWISSGCISFDDYKDATVQKIANFILSPAVEVDQETAFQFARCYVNRKCNLEVLTDQDILSVVKLLSRFDYTMGEGLEGADPVDDLDVDLEEAKKAELADDLDVDIGPLLRIDPSQYGQSTMRALSDYIDTTLASLQIRDDDPQFSGFIEKINKFKANYRTAHGIDSDVSAGQQKRNSLVFGASLGSPAEKDTYIELTDSGHEGSGHEGSDQGDDEYLKLP